MMKTLIPLLLILSPAAVPVRRADEQRRLRARNARELR